MTQGVWIVSRIIVTGGAGFIGSHIADRYIADGHTVGIIDNLSSGRREYIPKEAAFFKVDIKNTAETVKAITDFAPDAINHCAAQINVRKSIDDPFTDARENILGGLSVIRGAIQSGTKRFIFASTGGAIYGDPPVDALPVSEATPAKPLSPYAVAKLAMENYIRVLCGLSGIAYVILRYSNVYGPRQVIKGESGVVAIFTQKFIRGEHPVIFGDGTHTRDYVYIKDVVEANASALTRGDNGVINIGTGIRTSVNEIYEMLKSAMGASISPEMGNAIPGEVAHISLDTSLAAKVLLWRPSYDLNTGSSETVHYYKSISSNGSDG
jgi:UDP-glucose 4-epimerase